jgi:hypothetical protein
MTPAAVLQQSLERRLDAAACAWLAGALASLHGGGSDRDLYRSVSLVSRKLGKAPLALDAAERAAAAAARPGWDASPWTVDQAARVLLLLATGADGEVFVTRLDQLCATADVDELVAFYRGLPLYPDAPRHRARAAEGVRSNMKVVFEAVVHHNPYPAEQLPDEAWNQMVLKALFVSSPLHPIHGLDQRANPQLARMMSDYAHERWAARRSISPELWRCVGPFANEYTAGPLLSDLARVLSSGSASERAAAVLALRDTAGADARGLLDRHAALRDEVAARGVDWTTVSDFN